MRNKVWCGNRACLIPSTPATAFSNHAIICVGGYGGSGSFVGGGGGGGDSAFSKPAAGDGGDGGGDIGVDWNLREAESTWIARG